jgi:hypothetical protein
MVPELAEGDSDVLIPIGNQAGRLHQQDDRVFDYYAAQNIEESLFIPER